jgi:hypothetical protein
MVQRTKSYGAHLALDHLRQDLRLALRSLWRTPLIRPSKADSSEWIDIANRQENPGQSRAIIKSEVQYSRLWSASPIFVAVRRVFGPFAILK